MFDAATGRTAVMRFLGLGVAELRPGYYFGDWGDRSRVD